MKEARGKRVHINDSTYIKYKNRPSICALTSKASMYFGGREVRLMTWRGHEGFWDTGCALFLVWMLEWLA